MEEIELYAACIEKAPSTQQKENGKGVCLVGFFKNEQDAEKAIRLYAIVHRAMGEKFLKCRVIKTQGRKINHHEKYFKSLDEFINRDFNVRNYLEVNKQTAEMVLKEFDDAKAKEEKELGMIERMIISTKQDSIDENNEIIKYLEEMRANKTERINRMI